MLVVYTFAILLLASNAQITTSGYFSKASSTATTNNIKPFVDIFDCTCDYLSNICDTYCCCDPDCHADLRSDWTNDGLCTETVEVGGVFERCPDESILTLLTNPKSQQNVNIAQISTFLCVEYDMAPYAGYFFVQSSETSSITTREDNFNTQNAKITEELSSTASYSRYQRGIKVYSEISSPIVSATTRIAKFNIPKSNPFGFCESTYSAIYLEDLPLSSCTRNIVLQDDCTGVLSRTYYTSAIKPIRTPSTDSSATAVDFTIRNVITNNGASNANAALTVDATDATICTCANMVKSVDYYMVYDDSGNIASAFVDLVLDTIQGTCTASAATEQSFGLHYVTSANAYAKSGNPGYIVGKPLLIGTQNTSPANTVLRDIGGFYVQGISSSGECLSSTDASESVSRSSLVPNFGQNSTFSCFISLASETEFENNCNSSVVQALGLFQNFEGSDVLIGRFGSSNVHYIRDWISINSQTSVNATTVTRSGTTCTLPLDEEIYVFYAQYGLESNLLNYVVKVVRTFVNSDFTYDESASSNVMQFSQRIKYIKISGKDI